VHPLLLLIGHIFWSELLTVLIGAPFHHMPEGWDPEIPPLLAEGISLGWEPLYWKYALSAVSIAPYRRYRQ